MGCRPSWRPGHPPFTQSLLRCNRKSAAPRILMLSTPVGYPLMAMTTLGCGLDVALPCGEALLADRTCGKGHKHGRSALRALFDLDGAAVERGDLPDQCKP